MTASRGVHEFLSVVGGDAPNLPGEASLFARDQWGKPVIPLEAQAVYTFGSLIRKSEETLLRLFSQGLLSGTTHTCLGQELCQMSVVRALTDRGDVVLSNHRNHGHFLTYSGAFVGLLAEIMGREAGICRGIGGSQHLAHRHFHSNGVQAGMTAIGVGHAMAIRRRNERAIVAVVVGDGTLGEGLLYESLNLASIWKLPILFVVENNGIAQTTPTKETIGGSIKARGAAFGLKTWRLDDSSANFLADTEKVVSEIRSSRQPGYLVIDTKRLGPHSKGDDLRSSEEMEAIRARDPLASLGKTLSAEVRAKIDAATTEFIDAAHQAALNSPESRFREVPKHIFAAPRSVLAETKSDPAKHPNVRAALNATLHKLLSASPEVLILGEDLHDPYGGAFKVTAGLNTAFPGRVISTPISEAGIVGTGIGLALAGFRPIVEIMFADFVTLAMDQVFNHAVKFPGMFEDSQVPLVIRTPSGGRRGYGPTHSQSPETLMTAVPGLTVVFGSNRHDIGELLRNAVLEWPYPTVFFEHKLLYGQIVDGSGYTTLAADSSQPAEHLFPTLTNGTLNPDVTFVCYGSTVATVEAVSEKLGAEELAAEMLIPSLLSPLPPSLVRTLLDRERVIVFEEGQSQFGFSAELGATLAESGFQGKFLRVGPPPIPIPAARSLEMDVLPGEVALLERVTHSLLAELARQS